MNIINQRELIKRMAEAGALLPKGLVPALGAPVFVWPLPKEARRRSEEEIEYIKTVVLEPGTEVPRVVPFPMFRVATQVGFDVWWRAGKLAFTCLRYLAPGTPWSPDPKSEVLMAHEYWWKAAEPGADGGKGRGGRLEGHVGAWVDWKRVDDERMAASRRDDEKGFMDLFLEPLKELQAFLFDIEYPGNVVLKVGPAAKPGKSVEWRLARTHYCILRRGDARACRREATGPSEEQTARAAHWRKAHFRRLRSEVFTQKRGQLVAVRHAWVGPKEWEGKDGKVYRVVNFEGGRSTEGNATERI
ncbi:MAG: hypothetical protein WCL11_03180 [Verrucomicrobiota bacterium]